MRLNFGRKGTKTIDTLGNKSDKNEFQWFRWGIIINFSEFVMKRIANPQVQYSRIANPTKLNTYIIEKKSEQKVCRIEQKCIPLHRVERTAQTGLRLPNSKLRKSSIRSPHNIIHC